MTKIMGIINVTPDSFYEKSRSFSVKNSLEIARKMILDGADIIDIVRRINKTWLITN